MSPYRRHVGSLRLRRSDAANGVAMLNRKEALIAMSTMLLALPLAAAAQSETQLIDKYKTFAGSDANAKSLIDGLRDSKQVTLTDGNSTTTFTPPTQKMGNGNVNIALALTEARFKAQGVINPRREKPKSPLPDVLQNAAAAEGGGQLEH